LTLRAATLDAVAALYERRILDDAVIDRRYNDMKTLIIGYGNDSRNDDGVGWFVVAELAKRNLPDVTLETAHQLEVDFAETVCDYDRVIFVDAAIPESSAAWWTATVSPGFQSHAVAHFMAPGDVLGLCQTLYNRAPSGVAFCIRGYDFNFGTSLSTETRLAADEVIRHITALVAKP